MKYLIKLGNEIKKNDRIIINGTGYFVESNFHTCIGAGSFQFGKYGFVTVYDDKVGRMETIYTFEHYPIVVINND